MFDKNKIELHRIKSQPGRSTTSWENRQSQLLLINSTYIPNLRNLNKQSTFLSTPNFLFLRRVYMLHHKTTQVHMGGGGKKR